MIIHTKNKSDEFLAALQNVIINPFCFAIKKGSNTIIEFDVPIGINCASLFKNINSKEESFELSVSIDEDGNFAHITIDNMSVDKELVSVRLRIAGLDKVLSSIPVSGAGLMFVFAIFGVLEDCTISFSSNLIGRSEPIPS